MTMATKAAANQFQMGESFIETPFKGCCKILDCKYTGIVVNLNFYLNL